MIVPSFTFVSTASAFALRGARIVFADIRPDTLNLDETKLEPLISPRTRAIVPVHYAGVGCEMEALNEIAARHGVPVVEENAHGLFRQVSRKESRHVSAAWRPKAFTQTKNFSCGEGGAPVRSTIRSTSSGLRSCAKKARTAAAFIGGRSTSTPGSTSARVFCSSDLLAAVLFGQLEARDRIQSRRRCIWERYFTDLHHWAVQQDARLPVVPAHAEQSHHMFYLLMRSHDERQALIEHLKQQGILSVFHLCSAA